MARVTFAKAFRRHVECPDEDVPATTVGESLEGYFARHPAVRTYVLDDAGAFRRHVTVFVGDEQIDHRRGLAAPVGPDTVVSVFQALSGG